MYILEKGNVVDARYIPDLSSLPKTIHIEPESMNKEGDVEFTGSHGKYESSGVFYLNKKITVSFMPIKNPTSFVAGAQLNTLFLQYLKGELTDKEFDSELDKEMNFTG